MYFLVIDDDKELREMVCKILTNEGYNVVDAINGEEGMKIIKNNTDINFVITDIIMPEKEGLETIRELRQNFSNLKILAISGGGTGCAQDYLTMAKSMGANLTLSKPFGREELLNAINSI